MKSMEIEFEKLTAWGFVDSGTEVADAQGNRYVVGPQNEKGFVPLRNTSGGKNLAFDACDEIDHGKFQLAGR